MNMNEKELLYDTFQQVTETRKEAYERIYTFISKFVSEELEKRNIKDKNLVNEIYCEIFDGDLSDYGFLTIEETCIYIDNIIDNKTLLIDYKKRKKDYFKNPSII